MNDRTQHDVVSIGEAMLRLSAPTGKRLEVTESFMIHVGGAESNVVAALARLGHRCAWVSSLPNNAVGRLVTNQLRMAGVDLSFVAMQEKGRVGIYYVEHGTPPRPTSVIYDRQGSSFSCLTAANIEWEAVLNTRMLHMTGITPALSADTLELARQAIRRAHAAGVAVSFDVNYRNALWSPQEARSTLLPLMEGAELIFCAERDARSVFGLDGSFADICSALAQSSNARHTVLTSGELGVSLYSQGKFRQEPARAAQSFDRIGAGDAMAAGVIHGWLLGTLEKGLRYGVAMAALAHAQQGDILVTTQDEIESVLDSDPTSILR